MKLLPLILLFGISIVQGVNLELKSNLLNVLVPNFECRGGGRFGPPPPGQFPPGQGPPNQMPGQLPQGSPPGQFQQGYLPGQGYSGQFPGNRPTDQFAPPNFPYRPPPQGKFPQDQYPQYPGRYSPRQIPPNQYPQETITPEQFPKRSQPGFSPLQGNQSEPLPQNYQTGSESQGKSSKMQYGPGYSFG